MIQMILIESYQLPKVKSMLAPLKCVPLEKKIKNKPHLFSGMLLTLHHFPSHPPSKKSYRVTWSPQVPPQHGQRTHLREKGFGIWRAAPLQSMDGVVEQPCSISMAGETRSMGAKDVDFFQTTSGRANESTKVHKNAVHIYHGPPKSYMFRGFLWYIWASIARYLPPPTPWLWVCIVAPQYPPPPCGVGGVGGGGWWWVVVGGGVPPSPLWCGWCGWWWWVVVGGGGWWWVVVVVEEVVYVCIWMYQYPPPPCGVGGVGGGGWWWWKKLYMYAYECICMV